MNRFKYLIASLLAMVVISLTGCSDDTPAPKHNDALYGIYSRGADEFMEIEGVCTRWLVPVLTPTSTVTRWPFTCRWATRLFWRRRF